MDLHADAEALDEEPTTSSANSAADGEPGLQRPVETLKLFDDLHPHAFTQNRISQAER